MRFFYDHVQALTSVPDVVQKRKLRKHHVQSLEGSSTSTMRGLSRKKKNLSELKKDQSHETQIIKVIISYCYV